MTRIAALFLSSVLLSGCAVGHVRQLKVGAPGPYHDVRAVKVTVDGNVAPEVALTMADSAAKELQTSANLTVAAAATEPAFEYRMHVTQSMEPGATADGLSDAAAGIKSATGFATRGAESTGALAFEGTLLAPDEKKLGYVRWEGAGSPAKLADLAAFEASGAIGRRLYMRRNDFVERRPADERLFLTATPQTLEPGQFLFTNDEGLLFRLGMGIGRKTQLDAWGGGFPIPGGGFLPTPVGIFGGGGVLVIGFADVGVKHRFIDETEKMPAVSLSYDVLDVFLGGIGGGVFLGAGAGAAAVVGGANAQFNLGTLAISKHFGDTHVVAGGYVLDNHHWLPQSARFVAAGGGTSGSGTGGGTGGAGKSIPRLPEQYQVWGSVSQVIGAHTLLGAELMPRNPIKDSFGTTGVRWMLGSNRPWGPIALDRIRFRIDLAGVWLYSGPKADRQNADGTTTKGHGPYIAPLPWIGVGLYW